MALNISDITRHLERSPRALWLGHLAGVLPPWFFMLFLGMAASLALGIWDPVEAFMQLSPNRFVLFVLLILILVAQMTTNLTINILPPALVFASTLRLSWGRGVILTSVLATLSFPWLLLADSTAFFGFILYYSALFGPILGVMLADYYSCAVDNWTWRASIAPDLTVPTGITADSTSQDCSPRSSPV